VYAKVERTAFESATTLLWGRAAARVDNPRCARIASVNDEDDPGAWFFWDLMQDRWK
jgi:hypothetical protein